MSDHLMSVRTSLFHTRETRDAFDNLAGSLNMNWENV
jgi:hypothetical protein